MKEKPLTTNQLIREFERVLGPLPKPAKPPKRTPKGGDDERTQ
jgi:hypothetical protein